MERGTAENEGKLRCRETNIRPVMMYAINSETRQRISYARENKYRDNGPLLAETAPLRGEAARLLGYRNHAAKN
jgi:Zn-dependent oligopeptidase